ncbi:hypothetical protein KBD34_04770 [Patescibacteria group bacterium]|nr:hypothetical protein [Patescibacteria group bacterium]
MSRPFSRSEEAGVVSAPRLASRREALPQRAEPYAFEFDRSVAAVGQLLERSQVQADHEAELRGLEEAWQQRQRDDSRRAKKEMTEELYQRAIGNYERKLSTATTPDDAKKFRHGFEYYTESLRRLNEVKAKREAVNRLALEGNSDLYRAYAEHPEAVHAYYFTKALELWKLTPGVKEYGEAVLERERAQEAYINAQHDWFAKNCGDAFTDLKARQKVWEKDVDGVESWEVMSSFHVRDEQEPQGWHKAESSRRLSRAREAFIDPLAMQEREETFRELYADLYEAAERADTALIAARESSAERIAKNPALAKRLVAADERQYYWRDNTFALSGEDFVESLLPDGVGFSLGNLLIELDPEMESIIVGARRARYAIHEAKRNAVDRMYAILEEDRKNIAFAAGELQVFKTAEREQALAPFKERLLQSEQRVAGLVRENGSEVNIFLTRIASATYRYSRVGSTRYLAGKTTATVNESLKRAENYLPEYGGARADVEIRQQREYLLNQERLQQAVDDIVRQARGVDLKRLDVDSQRIVSSIRERLVIESQDGYRSPRPLDPLPDYGVSQAFEDPLAEPSALTRFGESVAHVEARGLNVSLLEGARACARSLQELIDRLTDSAELEMRRLGWSLGSSYASMLKLLRQEKS